MNKEKQLRRTLKKLKLQRDQAVEHATRVGTDAEAIAKLAIDLANEAKRKAEREAEFATMNSNELREEIQKLDAQLRLVEAERDEALNQRDAGAVAHLSAAAAHIAEVEHVRAAGQEEVKQRDALIDGLRAQVTELEAFKSSNAVKVLKRRLAKKAEELQVAHKRYSELFLSTAQAAQAARDTRPDLDEFLSQLAGRP